MLCQVVLCVCVMYCICVQGVLCHVILCVCMQCIECVCVMYCICVQGVLCRRDAMQMEYEITVEEANRKKDEVRSDLVLPDALAELMSCGMNGRLPIGSNIIL